MINGQLNLLGPEAHPETPLKTPVKFDRSFLIHPNRSPKEVIEPGDDFVTIRAGGREWFVTPVDPETGIPYPIQQHEPLKVDDPRQANLHHGKHPGNLFEISESLFPGAPSPSAREAERNALLQYVNPLDHNVVDPKLGNTTYHDWFFGTLPFESETQIFKFTVASITGIFPKYMLNVRGHEPKVVLPTVKDWELMRTVREPKPITDRKIKTVRGRAQIAYRQLENPSMNEVEYVEGRVQAYIDLNNSYHGYPYQYFTYRTDIIRKFITDYIFKQNTNVDENKIGDFLHESDEYRKRVLGRRLLAMAVDAATLDLSDTYHAARKTGQIHQARPRSARGVVWSMLGANKGDSSITNRYAQILSTQTEYAPV